VTLARVGGLPVVDADTAIAIAQAKRNSSTMSDAELAEVSANRAVSESRWNLGSGGTLNASFGYNAAGTSASDAYKDVLNAQTLTPLRADPRVAVGFAWRADGGVERRARGDAHHGAEHACAGGAERKIRGVAAFAGW
jgi:hypothetical protein